MWRRPAIARLYAGLSVLVALASPGMAQTIDGRPATHQEMLKIEEQLIWTGHLDAEAGSVQRNELRDAWVAFKASQGQPPAAVAAPVAAPAPAPASPPAAGAATAAPIAPAPPPPPQPSETLANPVLAEAERGRSRRRSSAPLEFSGSDLAMLAKEADAVRTRMDFRTVSDSASGLTIGLPWAFLEAGDAQTTGRGTEWRAVDKSIRVHAFQTTPGQHTINSFRNQFPFAAYNVRFNWERTTADSLAIEGWQGSDPAKLSEGFYMAAYDRNGVIVGYRVTYALRHEKEMRRVVNIMASQFPRDNLWSYVYLRQCGSKIEPSGGSAATIRIVYGTDRQVATTNREGGDAVRFGAQRGSELTIGCADISVPNNEQMRRRLSRPSSDSVRQTLANWLPIKAELAIDRSSHFAFDKLQVLQRGGRPQLVDDARVADADRALLFVHGYNVTFESAVFRAAQLAFETGYSGQVYVYSWPSRGRLLAYGQDMDNAEQSEAYLEQFIKMIMQSQQLKRLDLVVHSLGSQPVLRAIRGIRPSFDLGKRLGQVVFAAPDVGASVFAERMQALRPYAQRVTLYVSDRDKAMLASRSLRGGEPRAGEITSGSEPLVVSGVDTIDASVIAGGWTRMDHSYFADDPRMIRDISELLRLNAPPDKRGHLKVEAATRKGAHFWRLKPPAN